VSNILAAETSWVRPAQVQGEEEASAITHEGRHGTISHFYIDGDIKMVDLTGIKAWQVADRAISINNALTVS